MSDLVNRFTQRKKPSPPIKRLFVDQGTPNKKQNQARSIQPHKSIRKYYQTKHENATNLQTKDFSKRYIQKQHLKKELNHYNQQILLTFIRKMFFIMSGVILFNILFTSSHQTIILSNMMLALAFVEVQLGKDLLGSWMFNTGKELVKIITYCLNFYLLYTQMHPLKAMTGQLDTEILLISINAALNYAIIRLCGPFISLDRVKNHKQPYIGVLQKAKLEVNQLLRSFNTLYHLKRPILFINFSYWLIVIIYIINQRSQILLYNLVTLQSLSALILTTLLLYLFVYSISKVNEFIIIEMLSSNKKSINMSLLRLDCENKNNQMIVNQVLKYIWKNCEVIWDVELLAHNYAINYDVLEDYLNLQLQKINELLVKSNNNLHLAFRDQIKKQPKWLSIAYKWSYSLREVLQIYQTASLLQSKMFVFYIIEQIVYFQQLSNEFPINTKIIEKKLIKLDDLLSQMLQKMKIVELKQSINAFHQYFHNQILQPLKQ